MTADQVRELTHQSGQNYYDETITDIKNAASFGRFSILFEYGLKDVVVHRLEQDGFNVFNQDGKEDYERNVVVSWWPEKQ